MGTKDLRGSQDQRHRSSHRRVDTHYGSVADGIARVKPRERVILVRGTEEIGAIISIEELRQLENVAGGHAVAFAEVAP